MATTTEINLVPTADAAKKYRTASAAYAAACKIAADLGTMVNPYGASGHGNVAVGKSGDEYVICVRRPGRTTASGWVIEWTYEWAA